MGFWTTADARRNLLICLLLVITAFAVYSPVHDFEFVDYDDPAYVPNNPMVREGLTWEGVRWAFTTGHEANWFPLTWLSYMAEVQVFGVESGAMHMTNVALHAAAGVFLFLVLLRITGTLWPSAVVAFLFVLHPLHVESVAWVAERKDVLS